jgi:hypothetical protein
MSFNGIRPPKNGGMAGFPLNLLNGFKFPGAKPIDRDLAAAIMQVEGRLRVRP